MSGRQVVYWADGAGSSAVFFSLLEVLDDLRAELGSDRAIALYQPTGTTRGHFVLSDSVGGDLAPALANERLLINQRIDGDAPSVLAGVVASSTLRDFSIGLASALAVPWVDGFGRGVALIGIDDTSAAARTPVTEASRRLVTTLDQSRLSGTLALQHQLSEAVRSVLSEGVAGSGAGRVGRLGSLVTTAREIFGSDTAYLALPEEGDTANYYFAAMSNVETPQFRQLRMSFGQGLGGLARREGRVVRSLKYRDDVRLFDAPVRETAEEGIHSAMAAPLVHDGSVRGVLYVGNRHATPFSDTDERMLEEFADLVALLMGEPDYRPAVRAAQTARLREDFAHSIHDSVVRSLVHIGFTAEQASAGMRADDAARTISVIRSAAEDALANLRAELGGLTMDAGAGTTHIGEIVDQITDVPVRPGAERTVRVSADTADRTLPAGIADAVAQIGAEALTNAVLHSDATNEAVRVDHTETSVELTISDDGRGSPALRLGRDELGPAGHFGLQSMYRRAAGVGGHLEITSDDDGTVVHLSVPRTW